MFIFSRVDYEENGIESEHANDAVIQAQLRNALPWGQFPILQVDNKTSISGAYTICRFLAYRFNLEGDDEFENSKCFEIALALTQFSTEYRTFVTEEDFRKRGELRKKMIEEIIPFYMARFNKIAVQNGHYGQGLVGKRTTWVDFLLTHYLTIMNKNAEISFLPLYPEVQKVIRGVFEIPQLKEYARSYWLQVRYLQFTAMKAIEASKK